MILVYFILISRLKKKILVFNTKKVYLVLRALYLLILHLVKELLPHLWLQVRLHPPAELPHPRLHHPLDPAVVCPFLLHSPDFALLWYVANLFPGPSSPAPNSAPSQSGMFDHSDGEEDNLFAESDSEEQPSPTKSRKRKHKGKKKSKKSKKQKKKAAEV